MGTVLADGLNERGLNVNLLYLSGSDYGSAMSGKPVLSNLRMAAFVLDNFATVEEAIAGLAEVQIVSDTILDRNWGLHLSMRIAVDALRWSSSSVAGWWCTRGTRPG